MTEATKTQAKKKQQRISVADYIAKQVEISGKAQTAIAAEAGFEQNNMISMLKSGKTKLPLARVVPLAKALNVDSRHLFLLTVNEYMPEALEMFQEMIDQPVLTANELEIINLVRQANPNNPRVRTKAQEDDLKAFVETLDDVTSDPKDDGTEAA